MVDLNYNIEVVRLPELPGKVILKEIHWVMILDALRKAGVNLNQN